MCQSPAINGEPGVRTEKMEVLILGFPRTGTTSLRCAFRELGYARHYYWDSMCGKHGEDARKWSALLTRKYNNTGPITREDFDSILAHYTSLADWPCSLFAEELIQAYPEAKVILSVRDSADAWYRSFADTVWKYQKTKFYPEGTSERFWHYLSPKHSHKDTLAIIMENTPLKDFESSGRQWYMEHNEQVRNMVPAEKFLEFNAKQGWEPLCKFLGTEVPAIEFPRSNNTEIFQKGVDHMWLRFKVRKSKEFLRIVSWALISLTVLLGLLEYVKFGQMIDVVAYFGLLQTV